MSIGWQSFPIAPQDNAITAAVLKGQAMSAQYLGGYQVADQAPVLVCAVKQPAETDAERADRLAQEVGRLTHELRKARIELIDALQGDWRAARKVGGSPVSITLDGIPMAVMLIDDDPDADVYADSVWTGQGWLWSEWLTDEFKEAATKAALRQLKQDAQP